ncbi:MAG: methyl-accepting chemotaxis protein [Burkholderiales bacterium]|nr:methyl-accepting chemotaxis protein [Burkholderiales bacterium]
MRAWDRISLRWQLLVPVVVGGVIVALGVIWVMSLVRTETAAQAGVNTASAVAAQLTTLRAFYTEQIVVRARASGMAIDHDFAAKDNALPLPATMVKSLGTALAAEHPGMSVRLYSRYPFPFRAKGERYDEFEQRALAALETTPGKPYWAVETVAGRRSVRYAVADTMKDGCVGCHNAHAASPKTDWKPGDVRGVLAVTVPIDVVGAEIDRGMSRLALAVLIGIGLIAAGALVMSERVRHSGARLCASLEDAVRDKDFTARIEVEGGAELVRIGASVSALMGSCADSYRSLAGGAQAISAAVERVAHCSEQIQRSSQVQTEATASTAAAVQELTVSINHIADNTRDTRAMTEAASAASHAGRAAAQEASSAMERIAQTVTDSAAMITLLGQRSSEISGIAGVIKDIAEQTNLLALNAAIEAARAGEQGRGFAVVADEVRKLAERTSTATAQIEDMIGSIQQEIAGAVERLQHGSTQVSAGVRMSNDVAGALGKMEDDARATLTRVAEVANAAGEQGAAAHEIARNVERIARMTEENMREAAQTLASVRHLQTSMQAFAAEIGRYKYA